MGIITWKRTTMKFAVTAVVMAVLSSQALAYTSYNRPQAYSSRPNFYGNGNLDPAILAESTDVLLKTIQRTDELIDNLPRMDETARQMSDLWAIAYPQLKALLSKAGAWANQVPTPARRKRSPQYFYQGGNDLTQWSKYLNPALNTGSQELLLKTVRRTIELIDNLPGMSETAGQMAELWGIAFPQLKTLLSKSGAWANQVATPARGKRSPQFFYQGGNAPNFYQGGDAFNQIANAVSQYMDPALNTESQELLLKTVRRTIELIDNLPGMSETAGQMAELWGIAFPQLKTLLSKS